MAFVRRALLLLLLAARSVAGTGSAAAVEEADGQCAIQMARHTSGAGKPEAEQALQSHTCQGVKVWSGLPCSESCNDFCAGHGMSCDFAWWSSGADVCMPSMPATCFDLPGSPWNDKDNLVCKCGSFPANKKPPAPKVVEPEAEEKGHELKGNTCQGAKVWSGLPCSESCNDFCSGRSMSCADAWWSSEEDVCTLATPATCGDLAGSPRHEEDHLVCQCRMLPVGEADKELKSHICQGAKVWSDLPCSESCHDFCSSRSMSCAEAWWSAGEDICTLSLPAKCGDLAGTPLHEGDNLACQCDSRSMEQKPQAPKAPEPQAKEGRQAAKSQICQGGVKVVTDLHCSESCQDFCSGYSMKCMEVWWSSGEDLCSAASPATCGDMAGAPAHEGDALVCQCGLAAS